MLASIYCAHFFKFNQATNKNKQQTNKQPFPIFLHNSDHNIQDWNANGTLISIPSSIQGLNKVSSKFEFAYAAKVHEGLHIGIIADALIYTGANFFFYPESNGP